jgi:membrane glycosyltransferase
MLCKIIDKLTMTNLTEEMSKHPEGGLIATIMAFIAPYLDFLTSLGQFIAVVFGCIVGGATAYIKLNEALKLRRRKKNK